MCGGKKVEVSRSCAPDLWHLWLNCFHIPLESFVALSWSYPVRLKVQVLCMGDWEALPYYKICKNERKNVLCLSLRFVQVVSAKLLIWGSWGLTGSGNSSNRHIRSPFLYQNSVVPKKTQPMQVKTSLVSEVWNGACYIWVKAADAEVHPFCVQGSCRTRGQQIHKSCLPSNVKRSRQTAYFPPHRAAEKHLALALKPLSRQLSTRLFPQSSSSVDCTVLLASCGETLQPSLHANC